MSTRESATVVIRTETRGDDAGTVLAVFSGAPGTNRPNFDAMAYDPANGHYDVARSWYEGNTRPATAEEVSTILPALESRGYDVTVAKRMEWTL